jgi:hypothetical protein
LIIRLIVPLKTEAITSRRSPPFAPCRPEVREKPGPFLPVRSHGLFVVHERDQFLAGNAVFLGRPVPPAIRRLDGGFELLARHRGFLLPDLFHVVQELEEHDPGEHGQAIQVTVQALVFAHHVARGLDEAAELLGGGQRNTFPAFLAISPLIPTPKHKSNVF